MTTITTTTRKVAQRLKNKEGQVDNRKNVKTVSWDTDGVSFVIKNVPYNQRESIGEGTYSSLVTLKLFLLKDLMEKNEIPSVVDFEKIKNI